MLNIALLGCGRIGALHAATIAAHGNAALAGVFDLNAAAAREAGDRHGVTVFDSVEAALASKGVDAVLIATATDSHADLIEAATAAGKPVLCEKPIDLSLDRVKACATAIANRDVPIQLGFNRRFDPGHRALRDALAAGEIGELHQLVITSRDPAMPPRAYYEAAGGLLRDMTIHDFDLARFLLGAEPVEVFAMAGALAEPAVMAEIGDHDSAMILLRTADGVQCHINNARVAVYGYDQRVEALGPKGMLQSANRRPHEMLRYGAQGTETGQPYEFFFTERYGAAFAAQIGAFVDAIEAGRQPEVGFEDGMRALALAETAYLSLREGRVARVDEVL